MDDHPCHPWCFISLDRRSLEARIFDQSSGSFLFDFKGLKLSELDGVQVREKSSSGAAAFGEVVDRPAGRATFTAATGEPTDGPQPWSPFTRPPPPLPPLPVWIDTNPLIR